VRAASVTSDQLDGATGIRFEGNSYFAMDGKPKIHWGDRDYTSLSNWRNASGQERLGGADVGSSSDPRFKRGSNALQSDSPLIDRALNLAALFALDPGGRDFLGNPVDPRLPDVGAFEFVGGASS
jgi:hypothetical protein